MSSLSESTANGCCLWLDYDDAGVTTVAATYWICLMSDKGALM